MINYFLLFVVGITMSVNTFAQSSVNNDADKLIFQRYLTYIDSVGYNSKECLLQKTAEFFIGAPYAGGTLDKNKYEKLVLNLREFDCVTYIENVIALSNIVEAGNLSYANFAEELQRIRYRDSRLTDYASRLHYTTEWVDNNIVKRVLEPLPWQSENVIDKKRIDFMSTHRSAYNALKDDDSMLQKIAEVERGINRKGGYFYLPKEKIEANKDKIPHLAMIAFTTSIKGLDTTHTGFAYKKGDKLTFIHASSLKNKVVIDEKSLHDYCESQKRCTGIIIMKVL